MLAFICVQNWGPKVHCRKCDNRYYPITIHVWYSITYIWNLVDFYGKCREIYRRHVSYGYTGYTYYPHTSRKKKTSHQVLGSLGESNMLRIFQHTPWNIPQTLNPTLHEGISFIWGWTGMPSVCSRGMLGFSYFKFFGSFTFETYKDGYISGFRFFIWTILGYCLCVCCNFFVKFWPCKIILQIYIYV